MSEKTFNTSGKAVKIIALVLTVILALPAVTYAVVLFTSFVRGNIGASSGDYNGTEQSPYISVETSAAELSFASAASQSLELTVKNTSDANITYFHELSVATADREAASAVLVYYDGEFLGTLGALCQGGAYKIADENFIMAKNTSGEKHILTFEMHISAPEAYASAEIPVTVKTYTSNSNYQKYIFVSNETEFGNAVSDINSGLLEATPVMVIAKDIAVSGVYEIKKPVTLNLNGYKLDFASGAKLSLTGEGNYKIVSSRDISAATLSASAGSIELNNSNALLDIEDFSGSALYSGIVTATAFDIDAAAALVKARLAENAGKGIKCGTDGSPISHNLLTSLDFYKLVDTSSAVGYTYSGGVITPDATSVSVQREIKINSESCLFRVLSNDDLSAYLGLFDSASGELRHLAALDASLNTVPVMEDIFLPTAVRDKNITIKYTSSDSATMSSDGKIAETVAENDTVQITAEITVNESVYYHIFNFQVSSMTNESKFSNFVATINAQLHNVYKSEYGTKEKYFLPMLEGDYLYTRSHTSLTYSAKDTDNTVITSTAEWEAYPDIGLEMLTYTPSSTYSYVTLEEENELYLNAPTFYNFALLKVSGKFADDDKVYTETLSVTIDLGQTNDELYDLIFSEIESRIAKIDVLQNLLDTRVKYGMANERGDFWLTDNYMHFDISYSIKTSTAVLEYTDGTEFLHDTENKRFHIGINAEALSSQDSYVLLNVTVSPEDVDGNASAYSQERELTFKVPGIIRPDSTGISNVAAFSSTKYQVFNSLPVNERTETEVADGTELAERLAQLPEYDEAAEYSTGFAVSGGKLTNNTGSYILLRDAEFCKELVYPIGDSTDSNEHKVYTMSKLLAWATGPDIKASPIGTSGVSSDGKSYLTPAEIEEIKKHFKTAIGASDDTEWNALWTEEIATVAPGYVINKGNELNTTIREQWQGNASAFFKHLEILQWATDQIDWNEGDYKCPNMGTIWIANWDMSSNPSSYNASASTELDPTTIDSWARSSAGSASYSKIHTNDFYCDDDTEYLSVAEVQILLTFHLNMDESKGRAISKAFFESAIVPTNLNDGAVEKIISALYNKLNAKSDGFTTELDSASGEPYVSNMDGTATGIAYFKNLSKLYVIGEVSVTDTATETVAVMGQPAFIQSTSLSAFFNRVTVNCKGTLNDFKLRNAAGKNTPFDISNAARLTALTKFDVSYNLGITSVGALLNLPMSQLSYVNISGVNVGESFLKFPLENLRAKSASAALLYSKAVGTDKYKETDYQGTGDVIDALAYLKEIGDLRANYLHLCETLYDSKLAGGEAEIIWRIEEGNDMYYIADPGLDEMTLSEAKRMGANFYYCTADISFVNAGGKTVSLNANSVYSISYTAENGLDFNLVSANVSKTNTVPLLEKPAYENVNISSGYTANTGATPTGERSQNPTSGPTTTSGVGYFHSSGTAFYVFGVKVENGEIEITRLVNNSNYHAIGYTSSTTTTYTYTYTLAGVYNEHWSLKNTENGTVYTLDNNGNLTQTVYTTYIADSQAATYKYVTTETVTTYSGIFYAQNQNATTGTEIDTSIYDGVYYSSNGNRYQTITTDNIYYFSNNETGAYVAPTAGNNTGWEKTGTQTEPGWQTPKSTVIVGNVADLTSNIEAKTVESTVKAAQAGRLYYQYNGTTSNNTAFYNVSQAEYTISLTNGNSYHLTYSTENGLAWSVASGFELSETQNMEAILAEANASLDNQLPYYGNYYFYNGASVTLSDGTSYEKGMVYRLMLNSDRTAFEFVETSLSCEVVENKTNNYGEVTKQAHEILLEKLLTFETSDIGKIYYLANGAGMTYASGIFYEVTLNEETESYFLKTYSTVTYSLAGEYDRLFNERIYDIDLDGEYYGGTGGTHIAVISATVIIDGKEYTRLFEVPVIG